MAMQAGVPVVPIVMRNCGEIMAAHSMVIHRGTVDVAVLPPVPTDDWTLENLNENDRAGPADVPRHAGRLAIPPRLTPTLPTCHVAGSPHCPIRSARPWPRTPVPAHWDPRRGGPRAGICSRAVPQGLPARGWGRDRRGRGGRCRAAPGARERCDRPSVVIVGAGLAGVRAAHWLHRVKGITSTIYEGNTRAGGRCWSLRDYFDDGAVVEHGGQLINTDHNTIRNLISSLGLGTVAANGGAYKGWVDKYWIDGADYPYDAANADWGQVQSAMKAALQSAPYPQTYSSNTPAGIALDRMTVNEWLAARVPGGLNSRFAKLMQSNVIAEYGMDPDQQSALNLIYLLGWNPQNSLDPLNGADEKYTVEGGNDQMIAGCSPSCRPGR